MEEHVSWITHILNQYLGSAALALLNVLHIQPENPALPIPEHVCMALVVLVIATILALILKSQISVEKPGSLQQIAELLITNPMGFGAKDLVEENVHHHPEKYVPFVGSIGIFVLLSNLMSVFPSFSAPTLNKTVPLACATLTFLYFNWHGVKRHGAGHYLMMFAGSPKTIGDWVLAILLFPVEIISTSARMLSLTVRLWANILASDLIYSIFLSLFVSVSLWGFGKSPVAGVLLGILPATVPVLFIGLHIFVAIVQAYIFTILPSLYLGLATSEEH
jgi:F-type H+-transporting ATPase subunit a